MFEHLSNEEAERIYQEHRSYVYRTAFLLTKSRSIADDITQETFIRIFSKFHTFDIRRPLKPWVYRITINVTKAFLRKHKWLSLFSFTPDNNHRGDSLESTYFKNIEEEMLWETVNNLSEKSREIIILHFYSGLTLRETSEILEIPIGTVKSRLHTSLQQLRKRTNKIIYSLLMEE